MTGDADCEGKAAQIGKIFSSVVIQHPSAATHLLIALDFALGPSFEVVIAGSLQQTETGKLLKKLRTGFFPRTITLLRKPGDANRELSAIAPFTEDMAPINGKPAAYVCSNFTCATPTTDVEEMLHVLNAGSPAPAR
jgi:uncharacterized protein YyaL (SSP411 family)